MAEFMLEAKEKLTQGWSGSEEQAEAGCEHDKATMDIM